MTDRASSPEPASLACKLQSGDLCDTPGDWLGAAHASGHRRYDSSALLRSGSGSLKESIRDESDLSASLDSPPFKTESYPTEQMSLTSHSAIAL